MKKHWSFPLLSTAIVLLYKVCVYLSKYVKQNDGNHNLGQAKETIFYSFLKKKPTLRDIATPSPSSFPMCPQKP